MKILVIHATAGAGHKKAAEALYNGLKAAGHDARLVDALEYTNPLFKITYPAVYTFMVTRLPWLWAVCFGLLDVSWLQPLVHVVRRVYNGLNAAPLQRFLVEEQFDAVITTQFLSAEVSAYLKRTGRIRSKVICVVTDFDVHRIWVNRGIDIYTVASPYTREKLITLGVKAETVFVTGIPTDAQFSKPVDAAALKRQFGLKENTMTVLIATGSFGMGPIEELIEGLAGHQLVVICGHNKGLFERLSSKTQEGLHVFGLVHNMPEMMSVADIMITKPGGLSIAEALVKNLPTIFFSAIPGQETNNIRVLKKYGTAADQMEVRDIIRTVKAWESSPQELQKVRGRLAVLAKPSAVADIIRLL